MNNPSVLSKMLLLYLKVSGYKEKLTLKWWNKASKAETPPAKLFELHTIRSRELNKRKIWTLEPKGIEPNKYILYLHGSGYSKSFQNYHWSFISTIVSSSNSTIITPDYPLSTHSTITDVFDFLLSMYQNLIDTYGESNIVLMGDSAGGGMALALAELLVEKKLPQPSQIILLCPWLDVTLSNPQIDKNEPSDLILNRIVMQELGKQYVKDTSETHYLASPIYGAIKRLAPITLFIGTEDLLLADCRKLKIRAESEPMIFNYREFKGMVHNWMFLPIPDAKKAISMIVDQILLKNSELEDLVNADSGGW